MKIHKTLILTGVLAITVLLSCTKDLDQAPIDPDSFTEIDVFKTPESAKGALIKLYSSLALTGQKGPDGNPDIQGIDEGSSQFSRMLYSLQELTTDHAVVGWGDPGLPDLHQMNWTPSNIFIEGMYYRLAQEVSFANSFIANAEKLKDNQEVKAYIAEARFLRAYAYYNLMDLFANVPLITTIQTEKPKQSNRKEIFAFIESELKDIENSLKNSNEYGRVDKTAAQALLSRLYLNAKVFIEQDKYTECITYSKKVFQSSYTLNTTDANNNGSAYDELFLADNNSNGAQNEFIFTLNFDGVNSQTWGGTTFLIHAAIGGNMDASKFGVNGGWYGLRTTKALVSKFEATEKNSKNEPTKWADTRAMFHTDGQNYEINTIENTFEDGYAVTKFKNIKADGTQGSDSSGNHTDTDLPIIRLAEIYLNYAEAVLRGGTGGSKAEALNYINQIRKRAYGNNNGNITDAELTLNFVLDERSRELYWEGFRRTDLIRYNLFTTTNYLWPFKGNVPNGTAVDDFRNLFPIPANVRAVNPNINQNTGY